TLTELRYPRAVYRFAHMADDPRRRQLRRLDDLLEAVEQLRMAGVLQVPAELQRHVAAAAADLGQATGRRPGSVGAAHGQLVRLQSVVLRGGGGPRDRPLATPHG